MNDYKFIKNVEFPSVQYGDSCRLEGGSQAARIRHLSVISTGGNLLPHSALYQS